MDIKERNKLIETVCPVGAQRWLKVEYTDSHLAHKTIFDKDIDNLGMAVTSVGIMDEYYPQIQAINELKQDVIHNLTIRGATGEIINETQEMFTAKIDELLKKAVMDI